MLLCLNPCLCICRDVQVLALARLDTAVAVAKGPQLLQALAAAWADVQVFRLTQLLFGHKAAR